MCGTHTCHNTASITLHNVQLAVAHLPLRATVQFSWLNLVTSKWKKTNKQPFFSFPCSWCRFHTVRLWHELPELRTPAGGWHRFPRLNLCKSPAVTQGRSISGWSVWVSQRATGDNFNWMQHDSFLFLHSSGGKLFLGDALQGTRHSRRKEN